MAGRLELTQWQHRILALTRRYGSGPVVGAITTVSVVLSLAMTAAGLSLTGSPPADYAWAFAIAGFIPLVVAPTASTQMTRLLTALGIAIDELDAIAHRDALTGAASRRAFFTDAPALLTGPAAGPLVVAMIDADRFKQLNDTCGHAAGDQALVTLVGVLRDWVGGDGLVARLGGDEFALVRRLGGDDVEHELRRLRARCQDLGRFGDSVVSASVGAVTVAPGEGLDDALARADVALYQVKSGGRVPVGRRNRTPQPA